MATAKKNGAPLGRALCGRGKADQPGDPARPPVLGTTATSAGMLRSARAGRSQLERTAKITEIWKMRFIVHDNLKPV